MTDHLAVLDSIAEEIRATFEAKNAARDAAINQSRVVIKHCSNAIRAVHRHEWDIVQDRLDAARQEAETLCAQVDGYPDLYHSGYTQDALKEYVEAFERMLIDNTMRRHKGSIAAVMEELCLPRRTLNEKMAKYGLQRSDYL